MACVSRPADTSWNRRFDSAVSIMLMRMMRWSTRLRSCLWCEKAAVGPQLCVPMPMMRMGRAVSWTGLVLVFVHLLSDKDDGTPV
jgi:hypothetical protein